jgi:ABC-type lipoprotein release transport system permease subunit
VESSVSLPNYGKLRADFGSLLLSIIKNLPFEWLVGIRYTRAGKRSGRNSFISFISLISMAGIALGVAALIVVLSVMNGFQKDVRDRMLSVLAHIEVFDASGSMRNWEEVAQQAFKNKEVIGAAPYVDAQAMLVREGVLRGVAVRGVLPAEEPKVSDVASKVKQGSFNDLKPGEFNIVLGVELAHALSVGIGDKVTLHSIGRCGKNVPPGFAVRRAPEDHRHAASAAGGAATGDHAAAQFVSARLDPAEQQLVRRGQD